MEKNNEIVGLSAVKKTAEDMKTGAAVYKGFESKPSTLHRFDPDAPIELVKTDKENLVQTVKTEFARDPAFKDRLIKELGVIMPITHNQDTLPATAEQVTQELG